ncbi:MAG: hypothetical protein OHK0036_08270 [Bacteroidia bacterium]
MEKKKYLDLDRKYYIKMSDTTYLYKKIVGFTDTTISITTWTKANKDTTYSYLYKISKTRDTVYTYTRPIYRQDTIAIAFTDIKALKKDWFKNRSWLAPFGWVAIGAAMGVVFLPIAAIDKGVEGVKKWAVFEGILIGISVPPIFIGTRKTKYDLEKKWTLKTGK